MARSKMLDEIHQQPEALARTLSGALKSVERLKKDVEKRRPRLVVLAARGTSDNAALFGRYLLETATGIPVSLAAPSVFTVSGAKVDLRDSLVVAISQSGESTDTNYVLERAKEQGAITVGITNNSRSTLAKLPDHCFLVRAGKEKSVAATKTYTGQVLMLNLLAHALGAPVPIDDLRRLPDWAEQALSLEADVAERAVRYRFMRKAVVVGRGLNYSNAYEFALKLMETCYVVAERFSSADFLHGPIAMVEASFPMFLFAPGGATWPTMKEMLKRLQSLEADNLVITDRSNQDVLRVAKRAICLPCSITTKGPLPSEYLTPIPYIIPAQMLAACLAVEMGLNPDKPRTLSKVTQTL
jgi:glutamine---fructose-6-phosphate transaminase (isomerizing)